MKLIRADQEFLPAMGTALARHHADIDARSDISTAAAEWRAVRDAAPAIDAMSVDEARELAMTAFYEGFRAGRSAGFAGIKTGDGADEWLASRSRSRISSSTQGPNARSSGAPR